MMEYDNDWLNVYNDTEEYSGDNVDTSCDTATCDEGSSVFIT